MAGETLLQWDKTGEHFAETGVDKTVLYDIVGGAYVKGVAWNGFTAYTASPSGSEDTPLYANNKKYLTLKSAPDSGCTLEAYTYPDEWTKHDGLATLIPGVSASGQTRKPFGISTRTLIINDEDGMDHGYTLHLVYGLSASPSEKAYTTVNESPDAIAFSWTCTSIPVETTLKDADGKTLKPVFTIEIKSTEVDATKLKALEDILYGASAEPRMPLPDEVMTLLNTEVLG